MIMTPVNEVNNDDTKAPDKFTFHSVSPVCSTAEPDEQIDSQSMYM